ncbi:hypothetical protein [Colwellia sp. Bg11-12]|uniref:hypothetical protein n=1 Tax=Colwellia sp. Bg11-12 TaxID=2759817 RepID=UPI0015F782FF|nr:hypothetical protein [Colwellia sp. Bg11-12]MBA6265500.1 hypothetical protein [Colwellia sp. Bg11-12]
MKNSTFMLCSHLTGSLRQRKARAFFIDDTWNMQSIIYTLIKNIQDIIAIQMTPKP